MNTPEDLRKHMLKHAKTFIDDYVGAALGTAELKGSGVAHAAVWDLLSDIIKQAGDHSPAHRWERHTSTGR